MKGFPSTLWLRRYIRSMLLGFMPLLIAGCSSGPAETLLEKRLAATINYGWGWITAEEVDLLKSEETKTGIMGTFSYTLVIQKDAHLLPQEAVATFRQYVPQCKSVPIQKGKRCTLEETLLFVESSVHGWVPEIIARKRPELLNHITSDKE